MKKNSKSIGILIAAIIAVLTLIMIGGILYYNRIKEIAGVENNSPGAIDLTGYPNTGDIIIRSASDLFTDDGKIDGYLVSVSSKGYKGNIIMDITFDKTGNIVKSVVIKDNKESKGYGDKITEDTFLSQFLGITAPVTLSGLIATDSDTEDSTTDTINTDTVSSDTVDSQTLDGVTDEGIDSGKDTSQGNFNIAWADGTYEAEETEFDDQGYKDKVTLTIQDGKMTEVIWDAYNANGELKSVLSADGIYEMDGGGLTWQEQALAITDYLVQNQSTDAIKMDGDGKTDAVTGVTISVKDFIDLVKECLVKAVPAEVTKDTIDEPSTDNPESAPTDSASDSPSVTTVDDTSDASNTSSNIDAISGATISSAAVVDGINKAQTFIKDFVLTK